MKFRYSSNFVAGWLLALGAYPLTLFIDPLGLYIAPPDGGFYGWSVTATSVTAAVAISCYAIFARPFVTVADGYMIVQNPLSRWTLPLSEITLHSDALPVAKVHFRGKQIWLIGTERSLLGDLKGRLGVGGQIAQQVSEGRFQPTAPASKSPTLGRRWTVLDPVEVGLLLGWLVYVAAAWLRH